ncbi:MAG: hypothetical protein B7Y86_05220 [Brevundimonas subvibrioides]|uniref:Xylose isomerase-like TIM barrel domain-containing protein n=1 Tax=Brevundimonas subvibrioides TaxID=74313 RepID=A0A258HM62_9CAUL|nr:sugar phosphate isomerase/epimerase [Brevundimonas subvibrioides]OYX57869.1 MAG: hypothetical protein B7Y86_05220 [Brevundimonas subvibrioides]
MSHPLSIAHLSALNASPPELVDIAAICGFDFVGLRLKPVTPLERPWPLIEDEALFRETLARINATGVQVLDVELVRLTEDFSLADWEPFVETAARLGARHILTQAHDPEFERVVENYAAFCDLASAHGLSSDVEFLPWTAMRDLQRAVELMRTVDRPNAGICIDTLHFARAGCSLDEIDGLDPRWFRFAQIADAPAVAPATDTGLIRTARQARLLPGEGSIDLCGILSRLPPDIPLALEIPNAALSGLMSDTTRLTLAKDALLAVLNRMAEQECSESGSSSKSALA